MSFQHIQRSKSQSPQFLSSTSQFAPRPFPVQEPKRPPTQEDIENEAFQQNKFEAFGLQLKKKSGITPVNQERLGVLQAKTDSFWAQRMERAKAQPNLLEILIPNSQAAQTTESQAPVQPNTIQAKGETTSNRPNASVEQPPNKTGMPDALKVGVESLSGYSLDDVRVHYNSPKPTQLQALAYTQGTEIHVAPGQEKHLPHEAWHVVQQAQGRVQPTVQMKDGVSVNDNAGLEHEADVMGAKALAPSTQITGGMEENLLDPYAASPSIPPGTQRKAAGSGDIIQMEPATFFPNLTGVPQVGTLEFSSTWKTIRDSIKDYGRLKVTDLFAREETLKKITSVSRDWVRAYMEQKGKPSSEDKARFTFVQDTLKMAVAEEENEVRELHRKYGKALETGTLKMGSDSREFLKGQFEKNTGGALEGMTAVDIPALNALITYTAEGYRLQNPLLREGKEAFVKALMERPELKTQREAVSDSDENVDEKKLSELLEETKLTNVLVTYILDKMKPFSGLVYRGMGVDDISPFAKGQTVTDAAFASTTSDREFAANYIDSKKPYPMFQIIQSKTGRAIKEAVPGGAFANEVLFKQSVRFKVTEAPKKGNINGINCWVVKLSEV